MRKKELFIAIILFTFNSTIAQAEATKNKQAELDKSCEDARQIALKPRKDDIFHECLTKFKKSKSVCQQEADIYNGNRIKGAPMFYELPECEKAFQFRKESTNQ
ncbi:MAG: hypothetical protein COA59_03240 [Colwellia sp.]|jgi:hypothetical protein|nr:MAG: hypothetical protein COA59_03240 [Colwellia sp.]